MKRQLSLFKKTLGVMLVLMVGIIIISYLLVYFLMPSFYLKYKKNSIKEEINNIQKEYLDKNLHTVQEVLTDFANEKKVDLFLAAESDGEILFQVKQTEGTSFGFKTEQSISSETDYENEKIDEEYIQIDEVEQNEEGKSERLKIDYPFFLKSGNYHLEIGLPEEPLADARRVLIYIFPYALIISGLVSIMVAYIFSYYVVAPIKKMKNAAKEMEKLIQEDGVEINRHDEIGELGDSLNHLYATLKFSIESLEKQMLAMEEEKENRIQYFMNVSHELKTPLTSASALLEGMIYRIPPYQDYEKYLPKCLAILEDATSMTKKSLDLSQKEDEKSLTVSNAVSDCIHSYEMLMLSKHIMLDVDLQGDIVISTKEKSFRTVLSNIVSNAVYHTQAGGKIKISLNEQKELIVENSCIPLDKAELEKVFEPYYTNHKNVTGNGLGLYLTKHTLTVLKIPYRFVENEGKDGMQFIIGLNSVEI